MFIKPNKDKVLIALWIIAFWAILSGSVALVDHFCAKEYFNAVASVNQELLSEMNNQSQEYNNPTVSWETTPHMEAISRLRLGSYLFLPVIYSYIFACIIYALVLRRKIKQEN